MASDKFLILDSLKRVECFERIFLLVNIKMKVIFVILFPSFSKVDIKFIE